MRVGSAAIVDVKGKAAEVSKWRHPKQRPLPVAVGRRQREQPVLVAVPSNPRLPAGSQAASSRPSTRPCCAATTCCSSSTSQPRSPLRRHHRQPDGRLDHPSRAEPLRASSQSVHQTWQLTEVERHAMGGRAVMRCIGRDELIRDCRAFAVRRTGCDEPSGRSQRRAIMTVSTLARSLALLRIKRTRRAGE